MSKTKKEEKADKKKKTKKTPASTSGGNKRAVAGDNLKKRVSIADTSSGWHVINYQSPSEEVSLKSTKKSAFAKKHPSKTSLSHRTPSSFVIPHTWSDGAETDKKNVIGNVAFSSPRTSLDSGSVPPPVPGGRPNSIDSLLVWRTVSTSFKKPYKSDKAAKRQSGSGKSTDNNDTQQRAHKLPQSHTKKRKKSPNKATWSGVLLVIAVLAVVIGLMTVSYFFV